MRRACRTAAAAVRAARRARAVAAAGRRGALQQRADRRRGRRYARARRRCRAPGCASRYEAAAPTLDFAAREAARRIAPAKMTQGRPADNAARRRRGRLAPAARRGVDAVYTTPMRAPQPDGAARDDRRAGTARSSRSTTRRKASRRARSAVAKTLGIPAENVRVICPFVGGGFGCKGSAWSHVVLAAMAAKQTGRPVRLVLERPQMFGPVGGRPRTEQHIALAAPRRRHADRRCATT